jgi:HK97 family phage major capsid protein
MRAAGNVQVDPVLKSIQELNDSVTASFDLIEGNQKKDKDVIEASVNTLRSDMDRTRTEMLAGFKTQTDKINTLDRRAMALGSVVGGNGLEDCCLAALDEKERKDISIVEWMMASSPINKERLPIFGSAVSRTLVAHWLYNSMLLQKRRYTSQADEQELFTRMAKYEKALCEAYRIEKAAAFTTLGGDTLGGHWVPDPVAAELYRLILDNTLVAQFCKGVPMTTKTLDLPTEGSSSLSTSWIAEGASITDSVPASNAVNKVTLTTAKHAGRAVASMESLQDTAISILEWVQTKLTELAGRAVDGQILEGVGTPFTGLSNAAGVNEIVAGANGDPVTYARIVDTKWKAREAASRAGARWFMSPEMAGKIEGLVDSTGQPIVRLGSVQNALEMTMLGYPMTVHSVVSSARTKGTGTTLSHLYFGPPQQIVRGDRMGMAWDVSDIPGFSTAEVHMRMLFRIAIAVAVPAAFSRALDLDV